MLFATDPAVSRWLGVVNAMLYGPESSKVSEDSFQVIVREVAEITPRHDGGERPGTHTSASNDFNELRLVKVGDARGIRSEIQRCYLDRLAVRAKRAGQHLSAGEFQS